jgi:hypothetical protein
LGKPLPRGKEKGAAEARAEKYARPIKEAEAMLENIMTYW